MKGHHIRNCSFWSTSDKKADMHNYVVANIRLSLKLNQVQISPLHISQLLYCTHHIDLMIIHSLFNYNMIIIKSMTHIIFFHGIQYIPITLNVRVPLFYALGFSYLIAGFTA